MKPSEPEFPSPCEQATVACVAAAFADKRVPLPRRMDWMSEIDSPRRWCRVRAKATAPSAAASLAEAWHRDDETMHAFAV